MTLSEIISKKRLGRPSRPTARVIRQPVFTKSLSTTMKPIASRNVDARSRIISLKRKNISDARDMLGNIAKTTDARSRLQTKSAGLFTAPKVQKPLDMRAKLNQKNVQAKKQVSTGAASRLSARAPASIPALVRTVSGNADEPRRSKVITKTLPPKQNSDSQPIRRIVRRAAPAPAPVRRVVTAAPKRRPVKKVVVKQPVVYQDDYEEEEEEPETIYVDEQGNEIMYEEEPYVEPVYVPPPRPIVRRVVQRPSNNYMMQQPQQQSYMQQPQQYMQPMNNQYMQQEPMNNGYMQSQPIAPFQQQPQYQEPQYYQPQSQNFQQQPLNYQQQQPQRYSNMDNQSMRYQTQQPQRYQQANQNNNYSGRSPVRRQQQQSQNTRRTQNAPVRNGTGSRPAFSKVDAKPAREIRFKQNPLPASQRIGGPAKITGPAGGGKKIIGTRVSVSNLHDVATSDDIEELFENIGHVSNARMVSKGSVVVVFQAEADAKKAVEVYNNRKLDGQPMQVKVLGPVYQK